MYSQCPECHARFRVTAEALRAARGTVRCGRCGSAFDALAWLSDTVPPARTERSDQAVGGDAMVHSATPAEVVAAEYHFTADDLEKVFIDAHDWQKQFGGEATDANAAGQPDFGAGSPAVVVDENRPVEDITLEGERISIESVLEFEPGDLDSTDEFEVLHDVPESAYPEDEEADQAPRPDVVAMAESAPEPVETMMAAEPAESTLAAQRWRRSADAPAARIDEPAGRGRSSWRAFAWTIGCLLLALLLLAQIADYYRQDLVRHPQLGPVLRDAYARLGSPLSPNWDLAAFELRQWGNGSGPDANGRLSVRASLTNRANFAQPHPILRLELEDRFGESIAVRDFAPAEYAKSPAEAARLLGPGASTEAELLIVSPDPEAVGYRLDVCLRESAKLLRCAQGPG